MKALIALLTAATGILHLLVGFNIVGGSGPTNWILVLNGIGYLVLLWLFWTSSGSRRSTIRWILLAYTLITFVGYFAINRADNFGFDSPIGLIIKAIELLLIILLFLDRGSDRVAVTAPAPAATRAGAVVSSEAYQAASGIGAASSAAAIGAAAALDRTEAAADAALDRGKVDTSAWAETTDAEVKATMARATADVPVWSGPASDVGLGVGGPAAALDAEYVGDYEVIEAEDVAEVVEGEAVVEEEDWVERAGDALADTGDRIGDAAAGAWAATGAALAGAGAWLGDKAEDAVEATDDALDTAGDRVGDAVDATGDALSDAGHWVGDKVDDIGDTTGDAVLATGDTLADAGAGAGLAAGASAEWVGDTGDAIGGADRSVAAGGAAEWVGDTPDATGDLTVGAGVAAGAAAEWVGDTGQILAGAESSVAAGGAAEWVGDTPDAAGDLNRTDDAAVPGEPTTAQLRSELEEYLRSFGSSSEFRKGVEYIEGVGPAKGAKLRGAGIATVLDLMAEGATRRGRKNISDRTGLAVSEILTWVNHIDLFRIKGVAQEYADLLEQSGVDTVVELAHRNPNNLFKRMNDINEQKQLVRRTPHLSDVQSWVEQAKNLKRLIYY